MSPLCDNSARSFLLGVHGFQSGAAGVEGEEGHGDREHSGRNGVDGQVNFQ
jgi:hypothetical protein